MTPGSATSVAKYASDPTTRRGSIADAITPPGSTRSRRRPSSSPPWPWKYHHGMPFCVLTTTVSGPRIGASVGASAVRPCALTPRNTTSAVPIVARSPVTCGRTSKSPSALVTRSPRACIACRCGPRANSTTSAPAFARRAPMYPPTAPAPAITILISYPRGFAPRTPPHALSRAASPARSFRVARSPRSLARQRRAVYETASSRLRLGREGLGDDAALNLAGRGAWDGGRDVDLLGTLEIGQALLAVGEQLGLGGLTVQR